MRDSIRGFHGVRYQVKDVRRSIDFYMQHLGFKQEHKQLPAFAALALEALFEPATRPLGHSRECERFFCV